MSIFKKNCDNQYKATFISLHTKEYNKITLIPLQIKKYTGGRVNSTGKCQVPPSVVKSQQSDHDLKVNGETTPTLGTQAGRVQPGSLALELLPHAHSNHGHFAAFSQCLGELDILPVELA